LLDPACRRSRAEERCGGDQSSARGCFTASPPPRTQGELTGGTGVPYLLEAIDLTKTAEQCSAMPRPGGVVAIIGMIPFGTKIEPHGADFLRDSKIQGTSVGGDRCRIDTPRLLALWRQGRLEPDSLVFSKIKLERIKEGFAKLKSEVPVSHLIDFRVA
jgi:S-(hydroxymethyl)glutathione dehydrogenase / alcohol dehydrogenase